VTISVTILIIVWLLMKDRKRHEQEYFEELEIQNQLTNRNTLTGLTRIEENVLDIYEQNNIKIPIDILEDLRHMNLDDEDEIFMYIESQRRHWKLENSKKPYRKG